ncbi:methionine--tRNA ligase subunit beta [Candidatus Kaiserbacteria bacterium RIFCSPHIGHO2_01_FULL_48_10]|uniref:Methionine--tRNA ligase n=1 Tax=Candidatus Kaiserbacteria bacterium RIFCSPHIGHO2_01_FULL_48_10 TaxID=1798476 RepID=A0A1F6C548_9BACT|nr:MAG: methionine--tRNA ligase subunit beta [Candidatus Kaiserbacteria bacterium RIFCSPHIGHO2_01_FULL_48_10]
MTIDEFKNVDLRVAKIVSAERIEGSEKLLKLSVLAGDTDEVGGVVPRQVVAGIGKMYDPESLVGRSVVIVANLEPRKLMGVESRGMILAAHDQDGNPVVIGVELDVPPGSKIS